MVDRGCLNVSKTLSFVVDERVLAHAPVDHMTPLPDTFVPSNYDVLCGKGKSCFNHIGNRRFRITIEMNLHKYARARSKLEKSLIVMSIVDTIRESSPSGGFVKHNRMTGQWHEVGDHLAREKVGQALREALSQSQRQGKSRTVSKPKEKIQHSRDARPRQSESLNSLDDFFLGMDFQSASIAV